MVTAVADTILRVRLTPHGVARYAFLLAEAATSDVSAAWCQSTKGLSLTATFEYMISQ